MKKLVESLRSVGPWETWRKVIRHLAWLFRNYIRFKEISSADSLEERFTKIHKMNFWGSTESISGPGSTFSATENIRRELPLLLKTFNVATIFDAPCGDFNWMKHVLTEVSVRYIGGDIVPDLVRDNQLTYGTQNIEFRQLDISKDEFPDADLWICRDALFHLSYQDIFLALNKFLSSPISYLLTTTYAQDVRFRNRDIRSGDFRRIDLFDVPYSFPESVLYRFDDFEPGRPRREMCLWNRSQVSDAVMRLAAQIGGPHSLPVPEVGGSPVPEVGGSPVPEVGGSANR